MELVYPNANSDDEQDSDFDESEVARPALQAGVRVRVSPASIAHASEYWPGLTGTKSTGAYLLDVHGVVREMRSRNARVQWFGPGTEKKLYDCPSTKIYTCLPTEWDRSREKDYPPLI